MTLRKPLEKTRVNKIMNEDLKKATEILKSGGVILYPTDTIWGLGCDATNPEAIEKIYKIKQREDNKKLLVLLDNENLIERYVKEVPEIAYQLIELSDKPLTIIYDGAKNLAPNLVGEDGSIGIRITKEDFSNRLIQQFRKPIVSTSANIHNEPSPAFFDEISEEIKNAVDYVVQWRQDERTKHAPSGIIKLGVNGEVKVIRQ